MLQSVTLKNNKTGQIQDLPTKGLFICIGGVPHTDWATQAGVIRDEAGYLVTESGFAESRPIAEVMAAKPFPILSGDEYSRHVCSRRECVRHGAVKRCASAVGEGAMAVTFVHRYLADS